MKDPMISDMSGQVQMVRINDRWIREYEMTKEMTRKDLK